MTEPRSVAEQLAERHRALIARFLAGDSDAIVEVLMWFLMQDHPGLPDEVGRRLRAALLRYQLGNAKSLDVALGLDTSDSARAQRKLNEIGLAVHSDYKKRAEAVGKTQARLNVAARWGLSVAQLRRYCKAVEDSLAQEKK